MAVKLYVGGVPYSSTEEELAAAFREAGEVVSSAIVIDRMTNRSRGFAFIEMVDEAAADAAIARWNGQEFQGRVLTVNVARPKEDRPSFGGPRGGFGRPGAGSFGR